jgi:Tol biopolymer transport system component
MAAPVAARRTSRERVAWILAGVLPLVAFAAALLVSSRLKPAEALRPVRFAVPAPDRAGDILYATLSPDGRMLAFLANVDGRSSVWLRALDSVEARPLPGTEGATEFIWSGDSRSLAFAIGRDVKRIAVAGGPPLPFFVMGSGSLGDWSEGGTLLFANRVDGAIYRATAAGGAPMAVTTPKKGAAEAHDYASFLPDGRHFVFLARRTPFEASAIMLASLDSQETRPLLSAESQALYSPSGHLLFLRGQTLMAQPFDIRSLQPHGEVFPVAQGVMRYIGWGEFSVSRDGTLAFRQGEQALRQLTWLDREGRPRGTIGEPGPYYFPALTRDDTRLAVTRGDSGSSSGQIWLFDIARGSSTRFTLGQGAHTSPVWSRDGQHVYFASNPEGDRWEIRRKPWDSAGGEEVIFDTTSPLSVQDITPDGRFLAYRTRGQSTGFDLMLLPLQGEKTSTDLVRTPGLETQAQFSPDGRWVVYSAGESGMDGVFVQSYPDAGSRWQVSPSGRQARWRADGKELFYLALDGKLMAVDIEATARGLTLGTPHALFSTMVNPMERTRNAYVVARDGQRFLFANPVREGRPAPITIVLNWAAGRPAEP